jgi:hypothetical protein
MADLTVGRKARGLVVGIIGAVVVIQVTAHTIGWQSNESAAGVTVRTVDCLMSSLQKKSIMVKNSPTPSVLIEMAELTLCGKSGGSMIRLRRFSVIILVTIEARHFRCIETELAVTVDTIKSPVHTFQGITRRSGVVPLIGGYILPCVRGVAVAAVHSQPQLISVIWASHPVTGLAVFRSPLEHQIQMTVPTGCYPVFPDERKIGVVVGFHCPLLWIFLFFFDSMQLPEGPQQGNNHDHDPYFLSSHFRKINLIKNRCWSDISWIKNSYCSDRAMARVIGINRSDAMVL